MCYTIVVESYRIQSSAVHYRRLHVACPQYDITQVVLENTQRYDRSPNLDRDRGSRSK